MRFARFAVCLLTLVGVCASLQRGYGQGSLTPPGPPGPTMKTLAQIEPRTPISSVPFSISVSGSYYFTTNLSGVAGTNGIIIQTDDVTLDLNGFSLVGHPESLAGISVAGARRNIAIRNGTLRNWAAGLAAENGTHCRFEFLSVSGNRGPGIAAGANSAVLSCNSYSNEGTGIAVDRESIVRDCLARDNILHGIHVGFGSHVTGCTASLNSENGILLDKNCRVANSGAFNNNRMGISGRGDCQIIDSSAANNRESGIGAGANSLMNHCSATSNLASGVVAGDGGKITASAAQRNGGDGILVISECTVASNNCNGNFNARDTSGIHATGTDNCIKENNVISNDRGVTVDVSGNIIFKNTAANNTINYFIVGPQSLGPIFKDKAPLEVMMLCSARRN